MLKRTFKAWLPFIAGSAVYATTLACLNPKTPSLKQTFLRSRYDGSSVSITQGVAISSSLLTTMMLQKQYKYVLPYLANVALGVVDDYFETALDNNQRSSKGIKGHLNALRSGRITTGSLKIFGGVIVGAMHAALRYQPAGKTYNPKWRRALSYGIDTILVAGSANMVNLLDLRPGRAIKAVTLCTAPLVFTKNSAREVMHSPYTSSALARNVIVQSIVAIPADIRGKTMLGDTGAIAVGTIAGMAFAQLNSVIAKSVVAGIITTLTVLSEKISFTQVIAQNKYLHALDSWGRK